MKRIQIVITALFILASLTACGEPCTTCEGRSSGGQIMNPNNASQQVVDFLDQFATEPPEWAK